MNDGSTVSDGFDGSTVGVVLDDVRNWFERFIGVPDDLDLDLLTLWAAHTHVVLETYSTPRLSIDSTMFGSGKTTLCEHLQRLCFMPVQAASLSSPALLVRMLSKGPRTIIIDEVDRSLDPKKPGVEDLIAILNSGYKRGATRPVLVPGKGGEWDVNEMPTYSPVVMAGNAPHLPDDTRSRAIRVLLMPDLDGRIESSDWEEIEPEAVALAARLANAMEIARERVRVDRPTLPAACVGRIKEKWNPLMRVAAVAGPRWVGVTNRLIERDIREVEMDREDGLTKLPPAVLLVKDVHAVWDRSRGFVPSFELLENLISHNPDEWGPLSSYGRRLTVQRMGRMFVQGFKIHSTKNGLDVRGYQRGQFDRAWRQLGITTGHEPSKPSETVEPSNVLVGVEQLAVS